MRYYIMEAENKITLPKPGKGQDIKEVTEAALDTFNGVDYDMDAALISESLKKLMEQYMPRYDFKPFVYMTPVDDKAKMDYMLAANKAKGNKELEAMLQPPQPNQTIFWRFEPPLLQLDKDYKALYSMSGAVTHISFLGKKMPIVFTARSPKGVSSVLVRMAVAESALRRNFLSLKFTKLLEIPEDS